MRLPTLDHGSIVNPYPHSRTATPAIWTIEGVLVQARWVALIIWVMLLITLPPGSSQIQILLAGIYALGNFSSGRLFHSPPGSKRFRYGQMIATAVPWATSSIVVGVSATNEFTLTPAIFLILIIEAGVRYRVPGVAIGCLTSILVTSVSFILAGAHFGAIENRGAIDSTIGWTVWLTLMGTFTVVVIQARDRAREERTTAWNAACESYEREIHRLRLQVQDLTKALQTAESQLGKYQLQHYGISPREAQVLRELNTGKTYTEIGRLLHISPETVKAHVRNLGRKLGVSGGRQAVEKCVSDMDLLVTRDPNG